VRNASPTRLKYPHDDADVDINVIFPIERAIPHHILKPMVGVTLSRAKWLSLIAFTVLSVSAKQPIPRVGSCVLLLQLPGCSDTLERGRQGYESRQYQMAIAEFERALTVCPQRSQVLHALGQAQLMAGRLDASIHSLEEAAKLDPKNVMTRKVLGDALYLAAKEVEAEQSLTLALTLDPNFEPALYALGRIYYQQNRFPEAVQQFQKVIERDPNNYRAHDNLGLCYDAMYRDSEALRHFLKALDLVHKDHPEYDWAYANLAEFFLKRHQPDKAFQLAAEAAQRNPKSARNCFLTGKALVNLEKDDLSLRWLERAVTLDPNYREAHYLLARTYQKLGRKTDAEREFGKFREMAEKPARSR
jgi:tetratricopeptide (TPR) repeat protein